MAKAKYNIEDIGIGDKVSFQRKLSVNIYKDCEVISKLDKNLLIISIPGVKPNMIIDINEVIDVKPNNHSK